MNLFEFGPGNAHFAYELMPFFTPRCDRFVTAEEDQRQRRGERRAISLIKRRINGGRDWD